MKVLDRAFLVVSLLISFAVCASAADFTVTKTADTNDGVCDSDCSLREAVAAAVGAASDDNVYFSSAVFSSPQLITISSDIIITSNGKISIIGPGPGLLTVSGNNLGRIFTNQTGAITMIANMRLTGGTGVSTVSTGRGGAVYNNGGTLTLINLEIAGNTAANGGGVNTAGTATTNIDRCYISSNTATGSGGAIQNFSGNTTNITNSAIIGNSCASTSAGGGGIQANGTVTVTNTTFGVNQANGGSGGGIYFNGTAITLNNVTIANNFSTNNGGGLTVTNANAVNIRNSIFAGNSGTDVSGTVLSKGRNIVQATTASGWIGTDQVGVNPVLGPLGLYGGVGGTFPLLSTSTAINGGDNCVTTLTCTDSNPSAATMYDQRGALRSAGGTIDIGAFESDPNFTAVYPNAKPGVQYNMVFAPQFSGFGFTLNGTLPPNILLTNNASNAFLSGLPNTTGIFVFDLVGTSTAAGTPSFIQRTSITSKTNPEAINANGRVLTSFGQPISRAIVTVTDPQGNVRVAFTSPLGYYSIDGLIPGQPYTVTVSSKAGTFPGVTWMIPGDLNGFNIVAVGS